MATITNLQGSTQIWNSDEIINANFQNINNAMVENTGDESIAWLKTFTDTNFYRDATSNTENPYMRRLVDKRKVKNESDAGWVDFALYVDADNSVVWNRMWSLRWYPKKTADGSIWWSESFISCNFPTYDWATTYTKKTTINSELTVWTQDRTGAWTSYTNTISWAWGTTDPNINASDWSYKQIWKIIFVRWWLFWNSWDRTELNITIPITANNAVRTLLPNYMAWSWIDKMIYWRMLAWNIKYTWFTLPTWQNRELYTEFFYEWL